MGSSLDHHHHHHQSSSSSQTSTTLKLLKIVSNLVERQEIGQAIIDDILLDLLNYVYRECSSLANMNNQSAQNMMNLKHRITGVTTTTTTLSSTSNTTQAAMLQFTKELNEIKKATCNFLFQSFQLYFIWEFCANKFEMVCARYTSSTTTIASHAKPGKGDHISPSVEGIDLSMMNNVSPAQLCDLYEFILDLLTNTVCQNIL